MSQADATEGPLISLSCADFRRNPDGSWSTARQINIHGAGGEQLLLAEGRQFNKGQMFILGLDLVAVLENHCAR